MCEQSIKGKTFSIIIPVYNVEAYVRQSIDSVLMQDYTGYEVIMVDDGSTDNSGKICDEYAAKYGNFMCIHQENQGLSIARNVGIRAANGKYIVLLDSDDFLQEKSLNQLYTVIEKKEPDVVVNKLCKYDELNNSKIECGFVDDNFIENWQLYDKLQHIKDFFIGAWIFTVKKTYLENGDMYFYPGIYHEDEEWVPKIIMNTNNIAINTNVFYIYRINRENSIMGTSNIERMFDKLLIIELLKQEFGKEKYIEEISKVMMERIQCIYFGILCDFMNYKENKRFEELVKGVQRNMYLLKKSKKYTHKFGYVFGKMIGVKGVGIILKKMKGKDV